MFGISLDNVYSFIAGALTLGLPAGSVLWWRVNEVRRKIDADNTIFDTTVGNRAIELLNELSDTSAAISLAAAIVDQSEREKALTPLVKTTATVMAKIQQCFAGAETLDIFNIGRGWVDFIEPYSDSVAALLIDAIDVKELDVAQRRAEDAVEQIILARGEAYGRITDFKRRQQARVNLTKRH